MVHRQTLPITATDTILHPGDGQKSPLVTRKRRLMAIKREATEREHEVQLQVLNQERRASFSELDKEKEALKKSLQKLTRRRRSIELKRNKKNEQTTKNKEHIGDEQTIGTIPSRSENLLAPTIKVEITPEITDSKTDSLPESYDLSRRFSTVSINSEKPSLLKLLQKRQSSPCYSDGGIVRGRSMDHLSASSREHSPAGSDASFQNSQTFISQLPPQMRPRSLTCSQIEFGNQLTVPGALTKSIDSKSSENLAVPSTSSGPPPDSLRYGRSLPNIYSPIENRVNEFLRSSSTEPKNPKKRAKGAWKHLRLLTKSLQAFAWQQDSPVSYKGPTDGTVQNTLPIYFDHSTSKSAKATRNKASMHKWLGLDSPYTLRKMQGKPQVKRQDTFETLFKKNDTVNVQLKPLERQDSRTE